MNARLVVSSLIALAVCNVSYAQGFLVNWGGNYVSASTDLNNKNANTSGNDQGTNFSLTTVLSPTAGYSGTSATFYGGGVANLTTGTTLGWSNFQIQNQGSADMIDFSIQHGNDQHTFSTALVWLKNDFLLTSPQISFDASSQFAMSLTNAPTSAMNNAQARWLVQDGSTIYLSQVAFAPTNGNYTYNPFVDATNDGMWAVYAPSGLNINFDQVGAAFANHKFTDITAVGVYFESDVHENTGQPFGWSIPGFSVSAVPEPASLLLIGSTGIGLAAYQFFRIRRNRKEAMI